MTLRAFVLLVAVALPWFASRAQPHAHSPMISPDSVALRFITEARDGTERYRSQTAAIADGYRHVGPDLPSMGEHWLNIGLILADRVDAAHPAVLIYVSSPRGPVLAGSAYTRILGGTDPYPDFPTGLHAWHDHSGFIEDEALPLSHVRHAADHASGATTRLAFLHLWTWQENPAGPWAADNWSLPFVRAGVRPQRSADAAAHALALAADSGHYYFGVLAAVGKLDAGKQAQLRSLLDGAAEQVRAIPLIGRTDLTGAEVERLGAIWRDLGIKTESLFNAGDPRTTREITELWWPPQ
jgi:hypothetical protein